MPPRLKGRRRHGEQAIVAATEWAAGQAQISGLALVGSYAYGRSRMASDVDLIVMTSAPGRYLESTNWVGALYPGARLIRTADWGPMTERRLRLSIWAPCGRTVGGEDGAAARPCAGGGARVIVGGSVPVNAGASVVPVSL